MNWICIDLRRKRIDLKFIEKKSFQYLIKNPWKCDCHLAWLPAYLKRREAGDNEWAVCRSPAPLEGTFVRNLTVGAMQCQNADGRLLQASSPTFPLPPNLTTIHFLLGQRGCPVAMATSLTRPLAESPNSHTHTYKQILQADAHFVGWLKCRAEKEGPQQMPQNQEPAADVHCPEKCTCSELAIRVQRSVNDVITLTASIPTFIESREPAIRVDCANVRLSVVPLGIPDNTKELSLHDNNLECLASDTFADLVNLRVLSFDENPFLCYCNMQWLPDWMRRNRHRIAISPYPPTCQSPPSLAGAPIVSLSANHFTCLELSQETIQESSRNVAEDGLQVGQTTLPTTPPLECSGAAAVCCSERSSVCPKPTSCPKPCVCKNDQVDCSYNRLREVPLGIPEDTKDLCVTSPFLIY
ncbi:unnamed protein product [Schistocephalus solidus]|uniref:LRRCT domain-containing protein n=1 Tax=Schistocephalus solidus TaxID=70667 RepID=A0A183SPX7_SCHSO|nr:unnamed protein product [Schistocephalus solidus]